MRMRKPSGDANLAQETLGSHGCCEFGPQNFYRDLASVLFLFGKVDDRHAAASELTLEGVAVEQADGGRFRCTSHYSQGGLTKINSLAALRSRLDRPEPHDSDECTPWVYHAPIAAEAAPGRRIRPEDASLRAQSAPSVRRGRNMEVHR